MSEELAYKTISELSSLIQTKEISPVELTEAVLNRAERLNEKIHAYIHIHRDDALRDAKQAEQEINTGTYRGPMHGIPVAMKDMFAFKDWIRTMGSNIHPDKPAGYDATVVARLKEAGAIFTGTLHMTEYAMSGSSNPKYGICKNPWNLDYFPGGSSTGSGAALAADMVIGSVGSDTGGSVRNPSSWSGVVSLKPTYGRISKYGVFPVSWTYDHLGPMGKNVKDVAHIFEAIAGYDPKDSSTRAEQVPKISEHLSKDITGLTIGMDEEHFFSQIHPEVDSVVRKAIMRLEEMGANVKRVKVPYVEYTNFVEIVTAYSEAATIHQHSLRERPEDFGDDVQASLYFGHLFNSTDYTLAQHLRRKMTEGFTEVFREVDVLIAPSTPIPAPSFKDREKMFEKENNHVPDFKERGTRLSSPANAAGIPSISIPCGFVNDLPIGIQMMGKFFDEQTLFNIAYAYEQAYPLNRKPDL